MIYKHVIIKNAVKAHIFIANLRLCLSDLMLNLGKQSISGIPDVQKLPPGMGKSSSLPISIQKEQAGLCGAS